MILAFRHNKNIFELLPRLTVVCADSENWRTFMFSVAWCTLEIELIINRKL